MVTGGRGPIAISAVLVTALGAAVMAQGRPDLGWVRVPAGMFQMGCVESDDACLEMERPRHDVRFLEPFDIMAGEVTVGQYGRFVRETGYPPPPPPSFLQNDDHPVVFVSWLNAAAFCEWVAARLPTEAEWEYAARGGQRGLVYGWGDDMSRDRTNYGAEQCCAGAAVGGDAWVFTAPVRSFPPNQFGLYDLTGNVWEWVDGWLDDDYYRVSPEIDPPGATTGYARIARGGSWLNFPAALRTSVRLPFAETGQTSNVGLRCARNVPATVVDQ